jgi:hypothetical protein
MTRFVDREPVPGASALQRARDSHHGGGWCAIRVVELTPARAAALRMRIREVAKLHHPALARLVALGDEGGHPVVARQWVDGEPLRRPMTADAALNAILPVLEGLELAHWHDLYHGRLSAERIIRGTDGAGVLVDLGLDGLGSIEGDVRAVADLLESLVPQLSAPLRDVVTAAHDGAFPSAAALHAALSAARNAKPAPVAAAWPRQLFVASMLLLVGAALFGWCARPGEPTPEPLPAAVEPPLPAPSLPDDAPPSLPAEGRAAPAAVARVAAALVAYEPVAAEATAEPEPVEPPADTGTAPLEAEAPAPPPEALPVAAAPPEPLPPAPPPPAAPAAPTPLGVASIGAWTVDRLGAGRGVVIRLVAEADVADRLGGSGRPNVALHCLNGNIDVSVHPGVASVERALTENGAESDVVEMVATGGPSGRVTLRAKAHEGEPRLTLPKRHHRWLAGLVTADQVTLSYTPFASPAVVARFAWTGFDDALRAFDGQCTLE